ncbi:molybdenum cofactor guanylyltransferase [Metabacillus sediminilitoris]|uniref:molybdenum cofactor guanylyltransferase n=1 Tax=Metabacillus sediminilitoris TaxID=2567941 RepID=UPI001454BCF7|nr:molybdenum cofactor guanylyltransferase [Metabacillus sediminilitoris]
MHNIVGVLLAGGESRRFGQPKAFAKFKELTFWEHSYDAMKNITDRQLIISHPALVERFRDDSLCQVFTDNEEVKGKGPLAGIYTAMEIENAEWFVVLSCDIPYINEKTIQTLLDLRHQNVKAVIPNIKGKLHPLIGVYHKSILSIISKQLENHEHKMISLLEKIAVLYVSENDIDVDLKSFSNINSQKDYLQLGIDENKTDY